MSNFWARTITGLSMVFLIVATLAFSKTGFAAVFLLVTILALLEFYAITNNGDCRPQRLAGTILGTLWYILSAWANLFPAPGRYSIAVGALIVFFFVPFIFELFRKKEKPLLNLAVTLMGLVYIAIPLSLLNFMNNGKAGTIFDHFAAYLTAYFLITWIYDTGAYLVGITIGKHKFFERISPKKTWEGTIGGIVVALSAAIGLYYISEGTSVTSLLVMTVLVILFGTLGDLTESLFKRSLSLKDSGNLLPGHGGILDRFDTIFVSAPFVFLYFILITML